MNRKVKKFFKYMFIIFVFGTPLLYILGGNDLIDYNIESVMSFYYNSFLNIIESSIFSDLYLNIFSPIFTDSILTSIIFGAIVYMIFIDLLFILFDVLMFIPNVISKMLDKIGKVGVKDE